MFEVPSALHDWVGKRRSGSSATQASATLGATAIHSRSRRWVVDGGSCVDIAGGCTITDSQKNNIEEMETPMRTNGDLIVSNRLKAPLRSSTSADALIMKGCTNILSLGRRCLEQGFSFEWKAGVRPVLKSPNLMSRTMSLCFPLLLRRLQRRQVFPNDESGERSPPEMTAATTLGGRGGRHGGNDPSKARADACAEALDVPQLSARRGPEQATQT